MAGSPLGMGFQPRLLPARADYDGQRVSDLSNAVYLRITTPRGSYWDDAQFGSRLYLLMREKDLPSREARIQEYIREALKPLLDAGRAERIEVATAYRGDGRLYAVVRVFQAGQLVAQLDHPVAVQ